MGSTTSKGVLIQAKRLDKIARNDLVEQCRRMNLITKKGSVVWLYDKTGIKVARSPDVERGSMAPFGNAEFFERVLKCSIGDKRKVPNRSEEHTSELQSLMRISYAVFCLQKKTQKQKAKN